MQGKDTVKMKMFEVHDLQLKGYQSRVRSCSWHRKAGKEIVNITRGNMDFCKIKGMARNVDSVVC